MDLIQNIGYYMIWGLPIAGYFGIITFVFLLATASTMFLTRRQIVIIHVNYHKTLAIITISMAIIHFILAISIYI